MGPNGEDSPRCSWERCSRVRVALGEVSPDLDTEPCKGVVTCEWRSGMDLLVPTSEIDEARFMSVKQVVFWVDGWESTVQRAAGKG